MPLHSWCSYIRDAVIFERSEKEKRSCVIRFWKLDKIWRSTSIPCSMKIKLSNVTCSTVVPDGCESWIITKKMRNSLHSFKISCVRIMLGIKQSLSRRKHRHVRIGRDDSSWSLSDLKYLGYALRQPDSENTHFSLRPTPCLQKAKPAEEAVRGWRPVGGIRIHRQPRIEFNGERLQLHALMLPIGDGLYICRNRLIN